MIDIHCKCSNDLNKVFIEFVFANKTAKNNNYTDKTANNIFKKTANKTTNNNIANGY